MKAVAGGSTEPRRAFRAVSRTGGTPGPARTREGPGSGRGTCVRSGRAGVGRERLRRREPDRSLTERWARPPARGRRCRRRGRLARPRRISPPSRGSGAAAAAPAAGSPHVSPLPRNTGRRRVTPPCQRPRRVPETGPLPLSPAPAHKHTRVGTRPRTVPAPPGFPEAHRIGRGQATSSGPAALTLVGVPGPAPAHSATLAVPFPS